VGGFAGVRLGYGGGMKVLIGCEYSGTVRDAFLRAGHDAWSNDIIDTDSNPQRHLKMDVIEAIHQARWNGIIIHIPCTAMGVCGNGTYGRGKPKHQERLDAIEWSLKVWDAACANSDWVVMENPASVLFTALKKRRGVQVQYIQPWQFGHMEQKKTGLALHNAPPLEPTNNVYLQMMQLPKAQRERVFYMSPGPDRGKERARFYSGIADAMAAQWGRDDLPMQMELVA
jgi:hypothetical protein